MTAIPQHPFDGDLSNRLTTPLRQVARRRWFVAAAVGSLQTLSFALFTILAAALLLGCLPHLWMPVRVMLALATWSVVIFFTFRFLKPVLGRWSLARMAMHIEQDRPELHERISSAIELSSEMNQPFQGSPSLLFHLFSQAATDASAVRPDQIVPTDRVVRWALLLAPLLVAWIALALTPTTASTTLNGVYRLLMPWKSSAGPADPQWLASAIHAYPQINTLEIRRDYPAYTGLAPTITTDRDGVIQALVGTHVTLTIHTATAIVLEKSKIVIDSGTADEKVAAFTHTQREPTGTEYQSQFTVTRSGDYRINLINEFDLTNQDDQPRAIIAVADEVPTVIIMSPEQHVSVGPADLVPVKYIARDDFGIAKIEAIIQVDDRPARTVPIIFSPSEPKLVKGTPHIISVADVLETEGVSKAEIITYQLKVTDNRNPDPQIGLSNKQTLRINSNGYQEFEAKQEGKIAWDLKQAIGKAIAQLNYEQSYVQPIRDVDPRQSLDVWRRKQIHEAVPLITTTVKELSQAAMDARDGVFADLATQVQAIAEKTIRSAADDTVEADLSADNGQERQTAAGRAVSEIVQARTALQKLLDTRAIDRQLRQAEASRDLADAAEKQQQAADLMKSPAELQQGSHDNQAVQQQRQAMRKQEQANQQLQHAIQQSEALRDPRARETAQKLEELIHKVEDVEKHQDDAARQTEKQQSAQDISQDTNQLAQQQEELNTEIEKSNEQNKHSMQKVNADPPSAGQQQNIVKQLNQNQLQQAHDQMQQSANQLHQTAERLQNQTRSNDPHPDAALQEALNKDQHDADEAQKQQAAAEQAANELNKPAYQQAAADNAQPKTEEGALANVKQHAEDIQKQADGLTAKNPDAKTTADDARQHAKAAEIAADQVASAADQQEAQKHRNDAASELNQAAKALVDVTRKNVNADKIAIAQTDPKQVKAAAEQIEREAQKQGALAKAVGAEQKALAQVRNAQQADQTAQQQADITELTKDAKKHAEQLQQQAEQANNPNVEARAKQANADLAAAQDHAAQAAKAQKQAAKDQQEAANATTAKQAAAAEQNENHDLKQAADQQHQAEQALAKAEGELRNTSNQATVDAKSQATPAQQAAQSAQEAAQAQQDASTQNPAAAQQAAKALTKAAQQLANATTGTQPGQPPHSQQPDSQMFMTRTSMTPSQTPGKATDSKEGLSMVGVPVSLPGSVLEMGITADQWAILPPLVRKDLLNAAQQTGPPAYRGMMRDYFARVAKLQASTAGSGQ